MGLETSFHPTPPLPRRSSWPLQGPLPLRGHAPELGGEVARQDTSHFILSFNERHRLFLGGSGRPRSALLCLQAPVHLAVLEPGSLACHGLMLVRPSQCYDKDLRVTYGLHFLR